jgi:hypothetical protein
MDYASHTHFEIWKKHFKSPRHKDINFFSSSSSTSRAQYDNKREAMAALLNVLRDVLMLLRALKVVYKTSLRTCLGCINKHFSVV